MSNRPVHSHLQNKILLYMVGHRVDSISDLARFLKVHRASASRAIHALKNAGLVYKVEGNWWSITSEGIAEADNIVDWVHLRGKNLAEQLNKWAEYYSIMKDWQAE